IASVGIDLGKTTFHLVALGGYLHKLLRNVFYAGLFVWDGVTYRGAQESFIDSNTFQNAQAVLRGHHRPKYRKHRFAFSNLLTCAFDNSTVTAEIKKLKYIYYHCTGYRGKCALPYMREEDLGVRLDEILKNIHIPDHVGEQIESTLTAEQNRTNSERQRHASA